MFITCISMLRNPSSSKRSLPFPRSIIILTPPYGHQLGTKKGFWYLPGYLEPLIFLVELMGLEPTTSTMPLWRSPN